MVAGRKRTNVLCLCTFKKLMISSHTWRCLSVSAKPLHFSVLELLQERGLGDRPKALCRPHRKSKIVFDLLFLIITSGNTKENLFGFLLHFKISGLNIFPEQLDKLAQLINKVVMICPTEYLMLQKYTQFGPFI